MGDKKLHYNEEHARIETSAQAANRTALLGVAVQNVGRALPGAAAEVSYIKNTVKLTPQVETNTVPTVAKSAQYIRPFTGAEIIESQPVNNDASDIVKEAEAVVAGANNVVQQAEAMVASAAKPLETKNESILDEAEKIVTTEYDKVLEEARLAVSAAQDNPESVRAGN